MRNLSGSNGDDVGQNKVADRADGDNRRQPQVLARAGRHRADPAHIRHAERREQGRRCRTRSGRRSNHPSSQVVRTGWGFRVFTATEDNGHKVARVELAIQIDVTNVRIELVG